MTIEELRQEIAEFTSLEMVDVLIALVKDDMKQQCMRVKTVHPVSEKMVSMHPVWVKAMEELE